MMHPLRRKMMDEMYRDAVPAGWPTAVHPVALAKPTCVFCRGLGLSRTPVRQKFRICSCVYRGIFRQCLQRYREIASTQRQGIAIEVGHGAANCTRPREEYLADFLAVSRRALRTNEQRLVFDQHCMDCLDWRTVMGRAKLNRGDFWHAVYCIQEQCGRALVTVQPYRIFPLDEYFGVSRATLAQAKGGTVRRLEVRPVHQIDKQQWEMTLAA